MGRHAHKPYAPARRSPRALRWAAVAVVWAAGVAAGLFALLAGGSRFATCSSHATGLACRSAGTALAVLLLLAVVAVVSTATVLVATRTPSHLAVLTLIAVVLLVGCLLGARSLLSTA